LLEKVNEYKYLGLIFNSNGKLNNASQNLAQQGRKAYFGLRSKIQFGNNLSVKNWLNLYDSIISPIMTYGSEIWISDFNLQYELKIKYKYLYSFTFSNKLFLKVKLRAGSFVGAFLLFENIII
jgi:hypothetical protein